ncbi:DUF6916 family protein [Nocardioides dilutus]
MAGLEWLTCADFAGRVGDTFVVAADGADRTEIELVEATEGLEAGGPGPDGQERRQFSLVFRGPPGAPMQQGIRQLTHHTLGELDLFLVPIGSDAAGVRYEAAFA